MATKRKKGEESEDGSEDDDSRERKRSKKEAKKSAKKEAKKKAKEEAKAAKKEAKAAKKKEKKEAKKKAKKEKKRKEKEQRKSSNDVESSDSSSSSSPSSPDGVESTGFLMSPTSASADASATRDSPPPSSSSIMVHSSSTRVMSSINGIITQENGSNGWDSGVFQKKRVQLVISLLPASLGNVKSSIKDSLSMSLLTYSEGLGGIALAFDNITLASSKQGTHGGQILNELPFIHYNVTCDVATFRPKIGSKLTGVVTECFPSHLGILVLDFFNAMVPAEYLNSSGYSYNDDKQIWYKEKKDNGDNNYSDSDNDSKDNSSNSSTIISQNDMVHFVVDKIHECAGIVSMEGSNPSM